MKNKMKIILTLFGLFLISCSNDNSNNNPIGPDQFGDGGTGGTGGEITFKIGITQHQNDTYFEFVPSVDFKLTKLDASLNNQNQGTVNGDGNTVYTPGEPLLAGPATPSDGEKWTFLITGKIANSNKDFSVTVNYTVPQGTGVGAGNVTFTVSVEQDQQGGSIFLFKPSVDIKLTKLDAKLNGQAAGTVNGDGTSIYTVANGFAINVNNPSSGENWSFIITGTIANDGKAFTSNVNYTVP